MWVALSGTDKDSGQPQTLALLNDSKYSFSAEGSVLRMMMARSPIFGDHGNEKNEECTFTDQGVQSFKYSILPSAGQPCFGGIAKAAQELNTPLSYIFESRHGGKLPPVSSEASVSGYKGRGVDNVILSVIKKAEDGMGYVVRLYETDGVGTDVMVDLPFLKNKFLDHLAPFEIKTFRVANESVVEIPMTELSE
jgi:alpha-mannosidase